MTKIDSNAFPETVKFQEWYAAEKAKGLIDIKFFTANTENATLESFFAEINKIIAAETVDDPDFF